MAKNSLPSRPLTATGLFFILAAVFSGSAGLATAEPALLLASFLLLSFITASAVPVIITRFFWKGSRAGLAFPPDMNTPCAVCHTPARPVVPAAAVFLQCRLETGPAGFPSVTLSVPILPVTQSKQTLLTRGIYRITQQRLLVTDPARLFRLYIAQEAENSPIIIPAGCDKTASEPPPATRRQRAKGASTFERSEELHEIRSYMPGDDPRKIHWRAAAHTGELTIRQGELMPPPEALTTVIINPSSLYNPAPRANPSKTGETYQQKKVFDLFSARVCALLLTEALISRPVLLITADPCGAITTIRIPPGHTGRQEHASRFLALPQYGTDISPEKLFLQVPERSSVLLCCPDHSTQSFKHTGISPHIIGAVRRHSASCAVCIGPDFHEETQQSPAFFSVVNSLRYSSGHIELRSQNRRLFITETLLRKEGISVRRI